MIRVMGRRIGVNIEGDIVDVFVYNGDYERALGILGNSVIIERGLVPNVHSRIVMAGGVPHASLEDIIVSSLLNLDLPWYINAVKSILASRISQNLRWEWIYEVLTRFGMYDEFKRLFGTYVHAGSGANTSKNSV